MRRQPGTVSGRAAAAVLPVFLAILLSAGLAADAGAELRRETVTLVTGSGRYDIRAEIAATPAEQARGLMFRRRLGAREGMLFIHASPREATMWMRNTYIPLDMIFIRADGTVHRIERAAEPFSETVIASRGPVAGVLEVNAGLADELGLKPGDRVIHPHFAKNGKPPGQ